ncbi:MAG: single-stranded-DNA-specific exonuclease RecJ [Phycisphaera sp.]|nr:single-stranded-DNA-specific exonuclease RecJ [Phycisphaera sp.]
MHEAGTLRRWRWRGVDRQDREARECVSAVSAATGIGPLPAALLVGRGIRDAQTARTFLQPSLASLHDPVRLPGVERAAQRILQSITSGQPIVVYGDYDVDGVTASAILHHTLTALGAKVTVYTPHRIEEGYGLNSEAIRELAVNNPLIVSVDCGITALEPARLAKALGIDLVITDHHEFDPSNLPEAHALVHPRITDGTTEPYPFGELCGAGVALKLAWHTARLHCGSDRLPQALRELMVDMVSLAALGTVADVAPLMGENRDITACGLNQIKRTHIVGLTALIDAAKLNDERISAYHVGFVLGPRLNACGRMGHAREAVELLTMTDAERAKEIAVRLTGVNDHRRATERAIYTEAHRMVLEQGFDSVDSRAIVVGKEGWHPGVVGIVASRLVEAFARPVVMLHIDQETGEAHGSARSVTGVSIHEALEHCAHHFRSWGGHAMAAGVRLDAVKVEDFRRDLIAFVNERLRAEDLVGELEIDTECSMTDVNPTVWEQFERLAPFGRGNPSPVLCLRNAVVERGATRMGGEGKHLRVLLRQGDRMADAVGFGLGEYAHILQRGVRIDAVFEPKMNIWQGRRKAEMHIRDFKTIQ